jgi:methyl-accepting chemotaxis protein
MAPKKTENTKTHEELTAAYAALDRIQAIIEFNLDGTVITANQNFLATMGYELSEIQGEHHRLFCTEADSSAPAYKEFWERLRRGESLESTYKRVSKSGSEIWLQASYNPVFDSKGNAVRIIKFATDVSRTRQEQAEHAGMIQAIDRSQAVIVFDLNGTILDANENFLDVFGYVKNEVISQHHRIFCDPSYVTSPDYAAFWQRLGSGDYFSGEYMRLAKDGSEVWLQASYNPIFDADGRPWKVVKFASNITEEVQRRSLALLEMSTPVTKIWDGVLFAPIVGIVDSKRAMDILEKTLGSISENRAHTLLLDISGVAVVDTAVANHLIKITKAAVFMGCEALISGISPAIAQTITELGIDLGTVQTTSTIEDALAKVVK